jgi:hypothetical protein
LLQIVGDICWSVEVTLKGQPTGLITHLCS